MRVEKYPERSSWPSLLTRPYVDNADVLKTVREVLEKVRTEGDAAVRTYTQKFDGGAHDVLDVTDEELHLAEVLVPDELKSAIETAYRNIEKFHRQQLTNEQVVETMPGVKCWRKSVGIGKVGLYIPGGTAPLFSTVLMLAIPAKIAGCKEIILCTPPEKNGKVHPAILYSARLAGVTSIFKIGGAQAVAAMAYGTATVPQVYKIFGPGNQYVTAAKQLVQTEGVAIDMPAGPSEVCVLADDTAVPSFVAADLLSQAEHGADSQVLLVSTSALMIHETLAEVERQLQQLPRKDVAQRALANSKAMLLSSIDDAIDLVNDYAAEHLILSCAGADSIAEKIVNAGSIFIGNYSPESVGDYASGTNHTLPTNGFAKAYSGVSVDSFVKKITYQKLSSTGLNNIADVVIDMAEAEGLRSHANAVRLRVLKPGVDGQEGFTFDLNKLVRDNVRTLQPYSSARSEYSGTANVFLDANENSFGSPLTKWYNRYPDPLQWELKKKIGEIKNVKPEQMLLGNGSDECIDLVVRAFCEPKQDNIIICPPTYGMYEVTANINNVEVREVPLLTNFQLDLDGLERAIDSNTKVIFLCSPNNPTGNNLEREDIEMVLNNFNGLVVLDEAYVNYSRHKSFVADLNDYPNLLILQTFSKAWGLAALRLGMLFASPDVIGVLNKIKPPYNINQATQELALQALEKLEDVNFIIKEIVKERELLVKQLAALPYVQKIYPSDANFVLVKMNEADNVYRYLRDKGIIVRNRSNVILCEDSLRITVGTPDQDRQLIDALKNYS